ncbi:MAG: hypothetical protein AAAB35_18145, partial [Phyllobacterium sp.]|uniref:hypothetical protein n=1 Tax=Phyllobacterium sp. TaxID=1871046 RepID=UPI0030F321A1
EMGCRAIPKPGRETSRFHNVKIATEWLTKSDSALQVPSTLNLGIAGTALIHKVNSPTKNHHMMLQVQGTSDSFDSIKISA